MSIIDGRTRATVDYRLYLDLAHKLEEAGIRSGPVLDVVQRWETAHTFHGPGNIREPNRKRALALLKKEISQMERAPLEIAPKYISEDSFRGAISRRILRYA